MPRIRTIKPEAWGHRKVGRLSRDARLLWAVLITQADDEGRLVADPGQLRRDGGYTYDTDHVTEADVAKWLAEIADRGLIRCYVVDGVPYADFPSWKDHQRINKPTKSKLPSYPIPGGLQEDSRSTPVALPEPSRRAPDGSEGIKEGIKDQGSDQGSEEREEGRGAGGEGNPVHSLGSQPLSPQQDDHGASRWTPAEAEAANEAERRRFDQELEAVQAAHPDWPYEAVKAAVIKGSRPLKATVRRRS